MNRLAAFGLAVVLVVAGCASGGGKRSTPTTGAHPPTTIHSKGVPSFNVVPNVVGRTKGYAISVITGRRFAVEESGNNASPVGTVVAQSPRAGTVIATNSVVHITVTRHKCPPAVQLVTCS
jgi:hypothetical protein